MLELSNRILRNILLTSLTLTPLKWLPVVFLCVALTTGAVLGLTSETPRAAGLPARTNVSEARKVPDNAPLPGKQPEWKELFTLKHDDAVTAVAINGKMIAVADAGFRLRLWSPRDGKELDLPVRGGRSTIPLNALRFTAKDAYLMMTSASSAYRYEHRAGGMVSDAIAGLALVAWASDLSTLVVRKIEEPNRLFLHGDMWRDNNHILKPSAAVEEPAGVTITHAAMSGDGRLLVIARDDGVIRICDGQTLKERHKVTLKKGQKLTAVQLSEDGKRLACVGEQGFAKVFATADGKELCDLKGHDGTVTGVAFSPDGKRVATANGKVVRVFDARSGKPGGEITGHGGDVKALAFSPDGKRLVTGSADKTAKVWEVNE